MKHTKLLTIAGIIILVIIVKVFFMNSGDDPYITQNPLQEIEEAVKAGKPVFLEFYSHG